MRVLGIFLLAVLGCISVCSCDSARSSPDPIDPTAAVTRTQSAAVPAEPADVAPASAPSSTTPQRVTLIADRPNDVEVAGPGSQVLVVHVQIAQRDKWDPFSVRVQDLQGKTLGAFVVPYGQGDNTFPLRVTDPQLVGLKAEQSATLRALGKLVRSGGAFPHTAQLWLEFRGEP